MGCGELQLGTLRLHTRSTFCNVPQLARVALNRYAVTKAIVESARFQEKILGVICKQGETPLPVRLRQFPLTPYTALCPNLSTRSLTSPVCLNGSSNSIG